MSLLCCVSNSVFMGMFCTGRDAACCFRFDSFVLAGIACGCYYWLDDTWYRYVCGFVDLACFYAFVVLGVKRSLLRRAAFLW